MLFYGIIGALLFRAIFIAMGSVLMQYHWVVIVFGAVPDPHGREDVLRPREGDSPREEPGHPAVQAVRAGDAELHGQRFFVKIDGRLWATPLLVALLFLEMSDIIFAVDSVPAIFALTKEPLIVFTSNMFAILGLRAMYFMLAGAVDKFHMLKYGLAIVLVFVGLKMVWLNEAFGGKFPISWSLGIILAVIALSVAASLAFPKREVAERRA